MQSDLSTYIDLKKSMGAWRERLIYVGLGACLLIFLTLVVLPDSPEMYAQMLEWICLLLAGGLGGYGIGIRRRNRASSSP